MILVLLLHLLSTFSLSKALLLQLSPLLLMTLRMLAGGVLMLAVLVRKKMLSKIKKEHWADFGQVILFALLVPYYLRYWALSIDPSISYWYFCGLAVTYVFSILFAREKFSFSKTCIIALSYLSLYALLGFPHVCFGLPAVALIASVVSFAYGWMIIRKLIVENGYEPLVVNGLTMLSAGVIAATVCAFTEPLVIHHNKMHCIVLLAAVVLISNVLVHTWYMALLKTYSLTFMQLCSFIIPCWQLAWSGSITIPQACASVILVSCCGLYYAIEQGMHKQINMHRLLGRFYKTRI